MTVSDCWPRILEIQMGRIYRTDLFLSLSISAAYLQNAFAPVNKAISNTDQKSMNLTKENLLRVQGETAGSSIQCWMVSLEAISFMRGSSRHSLQALLHYFPSITALISCLKSKSMQHAYLEFTQALDTFIKTWIFSSSQWHPLHIYSFAAFWCVVKSRMDLSIHEVGSSYIIETLFLE